MKYLTLVSGAATATLAGMTPYFGHDMWFTAVTAGLGSLMTYMVHTATTPTAAVDAAPKVEVNK